MSDHTEKAEAVEAEIEGLQRESDELGAQIGDARGDWDAKKADPGVPGAGGVPVDEGLEPEADPVSSGEADEEPH